jgi:hypothetical protein
MSKRHRSWQMVGTTASRRESGMRSTVAAVLRRMAPWRDPVCGWIALLRWARLYAQLFDLRLREVMAEGCRRWR